MPVPVQYFQSIVAIELATAGALLFQIRFFEVRPPSDAQRGLPHPWIRLAVAVIIGATIFGSLEAMINQGGRLEAIGVTIGLGLSVLPILIRALPPLTGDRAGQAARGSDIAATVVGLTLYVLAVAALIVVVSG
jgi:hypothetical protein